MNLRVRVVHHACAGQYHWYADIDDADDPQPDDPFWYVDRCLSQTEALETACAQLLSLAEDDSLTRVQEANLVHV
ncbi:hypothetical protein GCM10009744_25840 [Kribbella alba]|uniref:DUF1902 domain-containing protein n=1 Tax=Kribbella alba TaxID=190197 RepID=A0ABP4R4M1_9ACTN